MFNLNDEYDTQNYPFWRLMLVAVKWLNTELIELTNQNSIKVPKLVNSKNKKTLGIYIKLYHERPKKKYVMQANCRILYVM